MTTRDDEFTKRFLAAVERIHEVCDELGVVLEVPPGGFRTKPKMFHAVGENRYLAAPVVFGERLAKPDPRDVLRGLPGDDLEPLPEPGAGPIGKRLDFPTSED